MNFPSVSQCIQGIWILFAVVWLISAFNRKQTKQRESPGQRLTYVLPIVFAWLILKGFQVPRGLLRARFLPDTPTIAWIGVVLAAMGIAFAFWARFHLGSNWSGVVTLKENHELIRTGPYRTVRHPIYSGILLGLLGTAVAMGEIRALVALAIIWVSFYIKARREESLLAREFGPNFAVHRQHTGMFFPHFS
jgi:protein-S-isoprenylcysteine O-methyltransferase Ste14